MQLPLLQLVQPYPSQNVGLVLCSQCNHSNVKLCIWDAAEDMLDILFPRSQLIQCEVHEALCPLDNTFWLGNPGEMTTAVKKTHISVEHLWLVCWLGSGHLWADI